MLTIGRHGTVRIDEARGLYVLRIDGRKPGTVTIETANDEVLFDHIIYHLALDRERFFSVTAHGLVSALVGRSLEEVERSLILATLRQHHFNRTRAAETLGISVAPSAQAEELPCRGRGRRSKQRCVPIARACAPHLTLIQFKNSQFNNSG